MRGAEKQWGRRAFRPVLLSLSLLAVVAAGCAETRPDLIVVVIDSLRRDHLGAYGYTRPTSAHIDDFATRATTFTNASAPSSWTKPSIGSLFTSRYPSEHGALSYGSALASDGETLATLLSAAGYRTIGVVGNFVHLTASNGMARGFDVWETLSRPAPAGSEATQWPPLASAVNARALALLEREPDRPFFLYLHYMEPHTPWVPPDRLRARFAPSDGRDGRADVADTAHVVELASGRRIPETGEVEWLTDLYDAEVAAADEAFGALLEALEERGMLDHAMVVVTADHGEELADRGGFFHGHTLHAELLNVPLLIRAPEQRAATRREEPVDLLDVPTTLLAAAAIEPADGMRGRRLFDTLHRSERPLRAELYPEPAVEMMAGPRLHRLALRDGEWKGIVDRERTLRSYQLDRDPTEARPVEVGDEPSSFRKAVEAAASAYAQPHVSQPRQLDAQEREALRALGYAE